MAQILRVSILGANPSGEVWSVNPCWEINGSGGADVTPSMALILATAIGQVAMPAPVRTSWATTTTWTGVRVEARALTGGLESQAEFVKATPIAGTGTVYHPHGTSLVLSLRTPGVGPSGRGRLYWPLTGLSLQATDFRVDPATRDTLLTNYKTFLSGVEAAIKVSLPEANLTVWSRKNDSFRNVSSLLMGNVPDIQRRRRDKLIENVAALSFP